MPDTTPDRRPPGPRDWKCDYDLAGVDIHLRPRQDLIWHQLDDECPCGPTSCAPHTPGPVRWVIRHHALDGRPGPPEHLTLSPAGGEQYDDGDGCVHA